MRIGVNYRLGLNPVSGVPLTIKYLYESLEKIDPSTSYTKFIPKIKSLSLFFDTIVCFCLLKLHPVHIFHGPSYVLPWCKPRNTKFIVTIHDLAFLVHPEVATLRFRIIYKFLTFRSLSSADAVIAVSENTKKDIIKYFGISEKKIVVIPNGISNTYLSPRVYPPEVLGGYILTITTHPQRKNTPLLVEAFKHIKNKNLKLVIVGNIHKHDKEKLEKLIDNLHISDRVVFTGGVSESKLASLYQHAKLFVYPSVYEGFGLPLLEAMACGCLVLGSKASCIPEIISDQRCLFLPINVSSLTDSIDRLLSLTGKQKRMITMKHKQFALDYSWKNAAEKYESLFLGLFHDKVNHIYPKNYLKDLI